MIKLNELRAYLERVQCWPNDRTPQMMQIQATLEVAEQLEVLNENLKNLDFNVCTRLLDLDPGE